MLPVHFAMESHVQEDCSFLGNQRIRKSSPLVCYTMFHRFSLSQRLLPGVPLLLGHKLIFMIVLTPNLKLSDILVKEEVRRERLPPKCITNVS